MSLDKGIEHGKEHRKPYMPDNSRKAISRSCRNHGGCPLCGGNRRHSLEKRKVDQEQQIREGQ